MEPGTIIDDIWAEEAGQSLRLIYEDHGYLRVELTEGVSRPATHTITLTDYRAKRLAKALCIAFDDKSNNKPEVTRLIDAIHSRLKTLTPLPCPLEEMTPRELSLYQRTIEGEHTLGFILWRLTRVFFPEKN